MSISDGLYKLFRQNAEGKGIMQSITAQEESSSRMFFFVEEIQRMMPFTSDEIFICEPEKGNLSFCSRKDGTAHAMLRYKDNRWYIIATNKQVDVWLSGIRLKYGQKYLVCSGDQITLKKMVTITVQCHPDGIPSRNKVEEWINDLEKNMEVYTRSCKMDETAFERIQEALLHTPLFCWGGFRPDPVTGEMGSFIQAIPVKRSEDWQATADLFNQINMGTSEQLCVPVFTSEEEASKCGCQLSAFPYDFPLPVFNQIVKMNMDVVINPFSQYPVVIPKRSISALWRRIQELNHTKNCPAPDWRMRAELARQMYDMEEDDFIDEF